MIGSLPDDAPRVLLDLGFPRNIDPRLKNLRLVKLYDLDDLASAASTLSNQTAAFMKQARIMVEEEAERFGRWLTASRLSPSLASIYRWAEGVRSSETESALRRLGDLAPREREVIEAMGRRLVSKLLAPATGFAKSSGEGLSQQERLRILGEIFASRGDET